MKHCSLFLFAAAGLTAQQPPEPAHARIIYFQHGDTWPINCPALTDCSIEAPPGEMFVQDSIGAPQLFPDSKLAKASRFYSIKPGWQGVKTSLHLVTDKQNSYGFRVLYDPKLPIDYNVILRTNDPEMTKRIADRPVVVPTEDFDREHDARLAEHQANEQLRKGMEEMQKQVAQQLTDAQAQATKAVQAQTHAYVFDHAEAGKSPWLIEDAFTDGKVMWIRRDPNAPDLPSVTAIDPNKKPEVIVPRYNPDRGMYVVPQVITNGYFSFGGKKKLSFTLPAVKS